MRVREETYWQWADAQLHSRSHDEALSDGTTLDVQVRLSRLGATQLFLGVYAGNGRAVLEEYYPSRPGETMTRALVWGVERARALATGALPLPAMAQPRRRA
ncbi:MULTISPECIES: hypothetical protein [Pseudomonas]|jgi:hypothetical protein|uniref:hypothetical protein n=1 Tax=Pseudomonas TaxID=286 RepID=UPI0003F6C495|nr:MULTISPECIES: hypothetical protein [Pseudomonas]ATP44785.1 hypothetical protein CR511_12300 [Pseudomonas putida]ATP50560.1 hypothetical protein CR512_14750 [Pseudomonas putida]MCX2685219.1 hypothetical protein [Pseudomonas sp. DCB_AW]MDE4536361.1 hypothetical protein [Pseudomonas sp. ITEM 17296]USS53756.1 hypothetical protein NG836_18275 [Pseudomonas kermanshahensis]